MTKQILYALLITSLQCQTTLAADIDNLKALKDLEVTSVSKQPERSFDAAAAIYVLTDEEIKRSGATSVPEVLRQVPGIEVARVDANKWAITSRGFNREFSNKLLVLVDGRTVYTPLFSGVYWSAQNLLLEDIDRIEVIRGPGASLWGSNAVNGVINITTKKAQYTQGNLLTQTVGTIQQSNTGLRNGGKIGENSYYRISGQGSFTDSLELQNGSTAHDANEQFHVDARVDWEKDLNTNVMFSFGAHKGHYDRRNVFPGVASAVNGDEEYQGLHALMRWENNNNAGNSHLQLYFDTTRRDAEYILEQANYTFDIEWQDSFTPSKSHNITWGLGFRHIVDDLDSTAFNGTNFLSYSPDSRNNNLYSGFLQSKYALNPELNLTLGSKLEHNYFTGFEVQPTARIAWTPDRQQTFWAAVSRAVRIPSRGERDISLISAELAPGTFLIAQGDDAYDAERLIAYEIGYRAEPLRWLMLDATAFINDYSNLRSFETQTVSPTQVDAITKNGREATILGFELANRINLNRNTTIFSNYSVLDIANGNRTGFSDTLTEDEKGNSPQHQLNVLIRNNISETWDFDVNLFHQSAISNDDIGEYTRLDVMSRWRLTDAMELTLSGQNLLDSEHKEFGNPLFAESAEIPRSIYLKTSFAF